MVCCGLTGASHVVYSELGFDSLGFSHTHTRSRVFVEGSGPNTLPCSSVSTMGFWRSVVRPAVTMFQSSKSTPGSAGSTLVEEADLHRLFLALEWRRGTDASRKSEEDEPALAPEAAAARLSDRAQAMTLDDLRNVVKRHVERQVRDLVHRDSDSVTGPTSSPPSSPSSFGLAVRPSGIPDAGRGVFLEGSGAALGQVVALMPGLSYSVEHIRDIPGYPSFGNDSMLMMVRHDGRVIDSRAWELFETNGLRDYNASRRKRDGLDHEALLDETYFHPAVRESPLALLAFGHLINHPPRGVAPNVLPAAVDWTVQSEQDRSMIPWSLFPPARGGPASGGAPADDRSSVIVPGLAFVATEPIEEGEELLVNYRLNPGVVGGLPMWYEAVDEEEDGERWR